jgi:hypothetical protein
MSTPTGEVMTTDTGLRATTTGSMVTHVTSQQQDTAYNPSTREAALPVEVHFADGRTEPSLLLLTPTEAEMHWAQVDAVVKERRAVEKAWKDETRCE